jgi:hypothetical protein
MGRVGSCRVRIESGCRVKNLGPDPTHDMVGSGLGFLVVIFKLGGGFS